MFSDGFRKRINATSESFEGPFYEKKALKPPRKCIIKRGRRPQNAFVIPLKVAKA